MTEPHGARENAEKALRKSFPNNADRLIAEMRWDPLYGCYFVNFAGMLVCIEPDGYVHT